MLQQLKQNLSTVSPSRKAIAMALLFAGITQPHDLAFAAALPDGAILTINSGTTGGSYGFVTGGSYFAMNLNNNGGNNPAERTALQQGTSGLVIGSTTIAGAHHPGLPNASDTGPIDKSWGFGGNTGSHYLTTAVTGSTTNGLVMTGWTVAWSSIDSIPMGTGAWTPTNCGATPGCSGSFQNGVATITWNGLDGGTYILNYAATVPTGDPSGFGGVRYFLHLEGTVTIPGAPGAVRAKLTSGGADLSVTAGSLGSTRVSSSALPAQDTDANFTHQSEYFDFSVNGLAAGAQVNVVIPLTTAVPSNAVYRKYNASSGWFTFTENGANAVKSAPGFTRDACPDPGSASYTAGLTAGSYCIQLTMDNGGPNDADSNPSNATILDPGGVASSAAAATAIQGGATGGCSLSAEHNISAKNRGDWALVLGFLAWLGIVVRRRQSRA